VRIKPGALTLSDLSQRCQDGGEVTLGKQRAAEIVSGGGLSRYAGDRVVPSLAA